MRLFSVDSTMVKCDNVNDFICTKCQGNSYHKIAKIKRLKLLQVPIMPLGRKMELSCDECSDNIEINAENRTKLNNNINIKSRIKIWISYIMNIIAVPVTVILVLGIFNLGTGYIGKLDHISRSNIYKIKGMKKSLENNGEFNLMIFKST